jgi:hypothetical protein
VIASARSLRVAMRSSLRLCAVARKLLKEQAAAADLLGPPVELFGGAVLTKPHVSPDRSLRCPCDLWMPAASEAEHPGVTLRHGCLAALRRPLTRVNGAGYSSSSR